MAARSAGLPAPAPRCQAIHTARRSGLGTWYQWRSQLGLRLQAGLDAVHVRVGVGGVPLVRPFGFRFGLELGLGHLRLRQESPPRRVVIEGGIRMACGTGAVVRHSEIPTSGSALGPSVTSAAGPPRGPMVTSGAGMFTVLPPARGRRYPGAGHHWPDRTGRDRAHVRKRPPRL